MDSHLRRNDKRNGFTLVELSIVLVVIGLIAGGVLVGKDLIRAAELRSVANDFNQFHTAIYTFQDKYAAFPGDITNATAFWGRADDGTFSGQCADPVNNVGTGTQTCNGDGNGKVGEWGMSDNSAIYYEAYRFWQHLKNAGLVNQAYTGVHGSLAHDHCVIGENIPASKITGGGFALEQTNNPGGFASGFNVPYGNYLFFGANSSNNAPYEPIVTPQEAWGIDKKIDDGMPGQGKLLSTVGCTNASNNNDLTATYLLDNDNILCSLVYMKIF